MTPNNYLHKISGSLGSRFYTLQSAFNIFQQVRGRNIVQVGSVPAKGAHEDTYLTKIICEIIKQDKKIQYNIFDEDVIYDHINSSSVLTRSIIQKGSRDDYHERIFLHTAKDNTKALEEWGKSTNNKIDLLVLNENQYPIKKLISASGIGGNYIEARNKLQGFNENELLTQYGSIINPCQERQLKQYESIKNKLYRNSVVILEGSDFPGGGQSCLAGKQLTQDGFICFLSSKQSVWVKR